jgi:hypothetical protein
VHNEQLVRSVAVTSMGVDAPIPEQEFTIEVPAGAQKIY